MIWLIFTVISLCGDQCPLSETELFDKRISAASGKSDIALELYEYHAYRNEIGDALFWLRVAAEQGNCKGMIEYSRMLGAGMQKKDEQAFWVKRAEDLGCDISEARYTPEPRS